MKKRKNQYMKMILSPCKTCLIFPCCTNLCEEKIIFTTERLIRLATFYNIEICDVFKKKPVLKYLENIRKENSAIRRRIDNDAFTSMLNSIFNTFEKIKEEINQEVLIEGPEKNKRVCADWIKTVRAKNV